MNTGYTVEVDKVTRREWSSLIERFDDGNIFQTWSYGAIRWGERNLSRIVLKKDGEVVAMAQAALWTLPILRIGIAYVANGPMWRFRGKEEEVDRLQQMLRALREEYAVRRGLFLRLVPNEFEEKNSTIRSIFEDEGFRWKPSPYRTILLNLSPSLEDLRKRIDQKWRNQLNRAEKNNLKLINGSDAALYGKFSFMYNQMLSRKQFETSVDINEFQVIQGDLPDPLKMKIIVFECEGEPVSALVGSAIGDTGIYLLGATSDNGMKKKGSYLLQRRMIQWLKESGCRYYDLGGIDPEKNPGVYHFKLGLSGKDVYHIGQFDACERFMSAVIVACGDQVRLVWRRTKICLNRLQKMIREAYKLPRERKHDGEGTVL